METKTKNRLRSRKSAGVNRKRELVVRSARGTVREAKSLKGFTREIHELLFHSIPFYSILFYLLFSLLLMI